MQETFQPREIDEILVVLRLCTVHRVIWLGRCLAVLEPFMR